MPEEEIIPTAEEPPLEEIPAVVWEIPAIEEPQPPVVEPTPEEPVQEAPSEEVPTKPPEGFEPLELTPAEPTELPTIIPSEPAAPPTEDFPAAPAPPPEPVAVIPEPEAPPAEVVTEVPAPPPSKPKVKPSASELLERARQSLARGEMQEAVNNYSQLTKQKASLDAVIDDLRIAIERNPHQPTLWQALGDAYMKADQLSEAIEAYRKGTEATT